jgi:uncharacterized protein (TIGR01244 family)
MTITPLSADFAVAPQVRPEDLASLKEAGYAALVNNRPDGEEPGQPRSAELRQAAERAGLRYAYIPIAPGQMTETDAQALRRIIADAKGPVLAFCRTGNRSTKLWELAGQQG